MLGWMCVQDLAEQLLSWKAFSSNSCVQQTCDVSVPLFCYTEHNHYKDKYLIEMGNIIYIGNGCFTQKKVFGYREKGVYLPIVLYLYNSKIKVPLNQDYSKALAGISVSVISGPRGRQRSVEDPPQSLGRGFDVNPFWVTPWTHTWVPLGRAVYYSFMRL